MAMPLPSAGHVQDTEPCLAMAHRGGLEHVDIVQAPDSPRARGFRECV